MIQDLLRPQHLLLFIGLVHHAGRADGGHRDRFLRDSLVSAQHAACRANDKERRGAP